MDRPLRNPVVQAPQWHWFLAILLLVAMLTTALVWLILAGSQWIKRWLV